MKTRTNTQIRVIHKFSLGLILLGLLSSCIQEIDLFGGSATPLIVSGSITNANGPHVVKLLFDEGYNVRPDYYLVEGATVKFVDDLGAEEQLTYTSYGAYQTSQEFKGEIGRTYHLTITLRSGERYESQPEKLSAVPPIQEVNYTKSNGKLIFNISYIDDSETANYYQWRFQGTYEVFAPFGNLNPEGIPRSGRCYPPSVSQNRYSYCWVTDFDHEFLSLGNDALYNGRARENVNIREVEIDRKFDLGYSAEVKQYSLTKRAYEYWSAIQKQLNNTGSIFETSNYQIIGNIRNLDNPDELVLGYFGASAVTSSRVFVKDYMNTFPPIDCSTNEAGCMPNHCVSCLTYSPSATKDKPSFWPEN